MINNVQKADESIMFPKIIPNIPVNAFDTN